jgi:hypothetical protein
MSFASHTVITHADAAKGTGLGVSLQRTGRGRVRAQLVFSLKPTIAEQFGWVDGDKIEVQIGTDEHHGIIRLRKSEAGSAPLAYRQSGDGRTRGGPWFRLSLGYTPMFVDRSENKRWVLFEALEEGWIEVVLPAWADETGPKAKADRPRQSAGIAAVARPPAISSGELTSRMMGDPPKGRSALSQQRPTPELSRGQARQIAQQREAPAYALAEQAEWTRRAAEDNVVADLMAAFSLTSSEARLVRELLDGKLKTRMALHNATYGADPNGGPEISVIDVFISKLRKKLKIKAVEIHTVMGEGYRMESHNIARIMKIIGHPAPDTPGHEQTPTGEDA